MAKKQGRPKNAEKRVFRGCRFTESSWDTLEALTKKYQKEAPSWVSTVSQRTVLEALIDFAARNDIPFSDLVGMTAAGVGSQTEE